MANLQNLLMEFQQAHPELIEQITLSNEEITVEVLPQQLRALCLVLRDEPAFKFEQLMDVCGVDYLHYGMSEWQTDEATGSGFERGVMVTQPKQVIVWDKPRFGIAYHLLSLTHNHRLRVKTFVPEELPLVSSVVDIWPAANWFERETFDLFGILFEGHDDLRRLLTDYGFIGHPFRKDFPLIGNTEVRYDAAQERVVYEPVSIKPRVLVPKVIRQDNRYLQPDAGKTNG